MTNRANGQAWASEEFGLAELGDERRVKRLVKVAAEAMNQPAGKVTAVFEGAAEREGTFRLLENEAIAPEAIARAAHRAAARRGAREPHVFVAVDGSSLNLVDKKRAKGLGVVGARFVGATGLQVMSALAISPQGVPLGLCGQKYWARTKPSARTGKNDRRPVEERETRYWIDVMQQVREVLAEEAPETKPWFQLDRAGDAWPVLLEGLGSSDLCTVRATYNRRLTQESLDEPRRYLWDELESQPVLGTMELEVAARPEKRLHGQTRRPSRSARRARVELRACEVSLRLLLYGRRRTVSKPAYALLARETKKSAGGEAPIEWMLLTNYPVNDLQSAKLVLFGYAQRWRIEEFHKAWKTGACRVEDTQLRDVNHIIRWATVLASVAVRIVRLSYLSRHEPNRPALEEFHQSEIDAIVIASRAKRPRPGSNPSTRVVVDLLARIGGYIGKSSGGPPGALVLARGLLKIESLAVALEIGLVEPKK